MACNQFNTLSNHAENYCRKLKREHLGTGNGIIGKLLRSLLRYTEQERMELPVLEKEIEPFRQRLWEYVDEGFLVLESDLQKEVMITAQQNRQNKTELNKIMVMGIPTRNHRKLLTHCVQSSVKNFQQNRECAIHIVDDSDEGKQNSQHDQALEELCSRYRANIRWVDRSYRQQFAETIANAGDIPAEVTNFALLGDTCCDFRAGASRNTLLLLAAGEPSIQVDDDMVCRIMPLPDMDTACMALSSETECNEYWFRKNGDTIKEQEWQEETDFLSLHETLLGKHPAALFKDHKKVNIDHLGGALLENLGQPEARIAVTYSGVFGDSGMYWHWPRLLLEGDSFRRLVEDASTYTDSMRTRQMLRGAVQPTIGDNPFCMAGNIGLDTRRLLPPFMPVQRNEDGIFGQLLYLCFKQACRGYLPYAILHDPPVRSSHASPSHTLSVGPLRTNDILGAVLWSQSQWPFGPDPSHNISVLGQYLFDLSQCSIHHFKIKLREICWGVTRTRINHFRQHIEKRVDVPDYWQSDARKVISNFQELMLDEDLCVPCDLPGNASERLKVFQELLGKFGQLLMYWPDIWKAATEINVERGLENR